MMRTMPGGHLVRRKLRNGSHGSRKAVVCGRPGSAPETRWAPAACPLKSPQTPVGRSAAGAWRRSSGIPNPSTSGTASGRISRHSWFTSALTARDFEGSR